MAISYRYFVFERGGSLKHVPRRISEGLYAGEETIPAYAGTKQRLAEVVIENEEGKAVRILDARGRYWAFDAEGRLDHDARVSFMRWYDPLAQKPEGKVVDLRPDLERKKWQRENFWDLTAEDLDRITAAVWPSAHEAAASVTALKGTAQKVPPLTNDGREALSEIMKAIGEIGSAIEKLSEPALKGLAYELRSCGGLYQAERGHYETAAAGADHHREIKARHRTGKGAWYAVSMSGGGMRTSPRGARSTPSRSAAPQGRKPLMRLAAYSLRTFIASNWAYRLRQT